MVKTLLYVRRKLAEKDLLMTPREYLLVFQDARDKKYNDMAMSDIDESVLDFGKSHKRAISRLITAVNSNKNQNN